ncbi:FYN-binding protein 2 isoform X1 [Heliangelus exortis]|uniref:FYN-binding protein 2 isoform X1 n=1 Tax=Heliangelus exortis TaxID=472823 RepID=UPI003A8CD6A4
MDVEAVTDFQALRAKFQNDSNLAKKLVQPPKKPPTKTSPRLGSGGNPVSSPLPLSKREEIILKSKDEHPQASALTQCNPMRWPRARLRNLDPSGHNEEVLEVLEEGLGYLEKCPEKPSCATDQHGSALAPSEDPLLPFSFHHALRIWENTSSHGEKASAMLPAQRAANIYVQPCPEQRMKGAPEASVGTGMQPSGSEPMLDLHGQEQDALHGTGPALPQDPKGHKGSDEAAAESMVATAISQLGAPAEQPQQQNGSEPPFRKPGAGKWSESPGSKQPRIKPLPSAESLGPPPGKPARPPGFDLGPFRSAVLSVQRAKKPTAGKDNSWTPKSAQLEEQHNYEESLMYLNQSGDTTTLSVIEVSKEKPEEQEKQKSCLFAKSSLGRAIVEDEKEEKPSVEREKKEAKKIFWPGGKESGTPSSQTKEDGRDGMKKPQLEQDVTSTQTAKHPAPRGLGKDGMEQWHYMYFGAPKPVVEGTALNQNTWQPLPAPEEIYDDVEKIQDRLSQISDASSPSASASVSGNSYEEMYEDVEIGSEKPAKMEAAKQKRFGNLFHLEKLKLKNIKLRENLRLFSVSVPNLAASQEDTVYDNVEVWQSKLREKDDKQKVRMPKFLMAKEDKDQRKSSNDGERNIFKLKKSKADKIKKMEKEEKIFRETFLYTKEIKVINRATAECSVPSKRRVDLPVTAGEQLDVIDVTEGSAVICRNAEGRYGYVLVEHLNFRQYEPPRELLSPLSIPEGLFLSSHPSESPC